MEEKAQQEAEFHIDFNEVLECLEDKLPMIPGKPVVQQANPRGAYKLDPKTGANVCIEFGKLFPREKTGKDKGKKAQKAPARKKDDKPKKPTKWADAPPPKAPDTKQLLDDYER